MHETLRVSESAVVFNCEGEQLTAILHQPDSPINVGMVMVVGGPQYRVGSHRQFVVLARFLAERGVSVLRFDYRGMGDSSGNMQDFEQAQPDIRAAIDVFFKQNSLIEQVVLWGLCDAASAIGFYAANDERVKGLVLLNPWVQTEKGQSKVMLKSYYLKRFFSNNFWKKLLLGDVDFFGSITTLLKKIRITFQNQMEQSVVNGAPLPERVLSGLSTYNKEMLIILSGNDLTAGEFSELVKTNEQGRKLLESNHVTRVDLSGYNHTFSKKIWRQKINELTCEWIKKI